MRTLHQALFSRNTAAFLGILTLAASLATGLNYVTTAFEAALPLESAAWHATASALAVELGVVFAGLTIAIRAREGDQNFRLYFAIVLFLAISMYANGDAVLTRMLGESPSWEAVVQMDGWSKARAVLLGSAVPLMVLVALESLKELAQSDPSMRQSIPRRHLRDRQKADEPNSPAGAARPLA
jgi:hypothetical protein